MRQQAWDSQAGVGPLQSGQTPQNVEQEQNMGPLLTGEQKAKRPPHSHREVPSSPDPQDPYWPCDPGHSPLPLTHVVLLLYFPHHLGVGRPPENPLSGES